MLIIFIRKQVPGPMGSEIDAGRVETRDASLELAGKAQAQAI